MQISELKPVADRVSRILKSIGSPKRLMVLCQLADGEKCVSDLCAVLAMSPPAMSQQLAVLRREAILTTRRDGQTIYYSISDPNILAIMTLLYELYCSPSPSKHSEGN